MWRLSMGLVSRGIGEQVVAGRECVIYHFSSPFLNSANQNDDDKCC